MITTAPVSVFDVVVIALARQVLFNGIRPGVHRERDLALFKVAMKVVYDEHGLIRGSDQTCNGYRCTACDELAKAEAFLAR